MKILDIINSQMGKVLIFKREEIIENAKSVRIHGNTYDKVRIGEQRSLNTSVILIPGDIDCNIGDEVEFR